MKKSILSGIFLCMVLNLIVVSVQASSTPVFDIKAIPKAPQQLLANSIIPIPYKVTNNSKITRTLTLSPIKYQAPTSALILLP